MVGHKGPCTGLKKDDWLRPNKPQMSIYIAPACVRITLIKLKFNNKKISTEL